LCAHTHIVLYQQTGLSFMQIESLFLPHAYLFPSHHMYVCKKYIWICSSLLPHHI